MLTTIIRIIIQTKASCINALSERLSHMNVSICILSFCCYFHSFDASRVLCHVCVSIITWLDIL